MHAIEISGPRNSDADKVLTREALAFVAELETRFGSTRLELLDHDQLGFWERNGYHHRGDPWREERYSVDDYVARTMRRQARAGARDGGLAG